MRGALTALACLAAGAVSAQDWQDVSAIFDARCVLCHSGEYAPLGLELDSLASALKGGENGPVLIAGAPHDSALLARIEGRIEPRMPMDGPPWLSDDEIARIAAWIEAGLPGEELAVPPEATEPERPDGEVWFQDVEGIFLQRCAKCHSEGSILGAPPEGLRLSSLSEILEGGERVVILPGNSALSLVWRHVSGVEQPRMPLDGPPYLTDDEVALIAQWIDGGARDGNGEVAPVPVGREIRAEGILTDTRALDGGAFLVVPGTRVEDGFRVGGRYELRGVVGPEGDIIAERFRAR